MKFKSGMQVVIVGSGSALRDPVRANPSQAVVIDGEVLLFDCGERATVNLTLAGINPIDVDTLFLTHLHWDHMVDYNYLLMTTWNSGKDNTLNVYGPPGTQEMHDAFLKAHAVDVEFVRVFVESLPDHITERPKPVPDVKIHGLQEGVVLETDSYRVIALEVQHLNLLGFEHSSWGFRVESDYGTVALSGDTVPCDAIVELAKDVDLLVHEATFLDEIIAQRAPAWTGHSGPTDVGRTAQLAGARKVVLTHLGPYDSVPKAVEMASMYYGPRQGPQIWSKILSDTASQYDGPIVIGEDAMVFEIGAKS